MFNYYFTYQLFSLGVFEEVTPVNKDAVEFELGLDIIEGQLQ